MGYDELDPISARRFVDTARRYCDAKREHERHARAAWIGELVVSFTDQDLAALATAGYLSRLDLDSLAWAGRPVNM